MTLAHNWLPLLRAALAGDIGLFLAWLSRLNLFRQHVVIGCDAGPFAAEIAALAAEQAAETGVKVFAADRPCPFPAFHFALCTKRAVAGLYVSTDADGIRLTAYDRRGLPVDLRAAAAEAADPAGAPPGGSAPAPAPLPALPGGDGRVEWFDARTPYQCHLVNQVRTKAIRVLGDSGLRMVIDTQYGAASGYLEPVLRQLGFTHRDNFSIRCETDRAVSRRRLRLTARDLEPLVGKVLCYQLDIGAAISPDGTALALVDGTGEPLTLPDRALAALEGPAPDALLAFLRYLECIGEMELRRTAHAAALEGEALP